MASKWPMSTYLPNDQQSNRSSRTTSPSKSALQYKSAEFISDEEEDAEAEGGEEAKVDGDL